MANKKEIWRCNVKIQVWLEVYKPKTREIALSHLSKFYKIEKLLKGNTEEELLDSRINDYAIKSLQQEYAGKYSSKVKLIECEKLTYHGMTNYNI